jgi:ABC-2 type transport system permease protein
VISANVPGAIFLSETLAEYSALMIMERTYGKDRIRAFLKRNLDLYLRGRGGDAKERPLTLVGRHQEHIAYKKGGIAMYALKEAIGEAAVNRALARLVREHASKSNPYPTPDDLIRLLRAEAGPAHRQLITDLFQKIVLWDYGVVSAKAAATQDGKWLVELKVRARKLEADESGVEKEVPLDQYVDVGLFAADPRAPSFTSRDVIVLDRRRLKSGTHTIKLVTAQRPAFAGINPYLTLVQRHDVGTVVSVPP